MKRDIHRRLRKLEGATSGSRWVESGRFRFLTRDGWALLVVPRVVRAAGTEDHASELLAAAQAAGIQVRWGKEA